MDPRPTSHDIVHDMLTMSYLDALSGPIAGSVLEYDLEPRPLPLLIILDVTSNGIKFYNIMFIYYYFMVRLGKFNIWFELCDYGRLGD